MINEWFETYTGLQFQPFAPKPEQISLMDIAHSLSNICRYNGHCKHFFSVAQHSLNCAEFAKNNGYDKRMQLWSLFHDAAEAYISDLPGPIKRHMPEFNKLEENIQRVIYEALKIPSPDSEKHEWIINRIDQIMLITEGSKLGYISFQEWIPYLSPDNEIEIIALPIPYVKRMFMAKAGDLLEAVKQDIK